MIKARNPNLQVVIPTHGRVNRQTTLNFFPKGLREQILVVTSLEKEAKAIREQGHKYTVSLESKGALESHGQRIHTKRQWIIENVAASSIMQIDDDCYLNVRASPKWREYKGTDAKPSEKRWRLTEKAKAKGVRMLVNMDKNELQQYEHMMQQLEKLASKYGHGCLSSRMGNDIFEKEVDVGGVRVMHAIIHNPELMRQTKVRFDTMPFREDFNVTLALLRKGHKAFRLNYYMVNPQSFGAAGGCSDYRTMEASNIAATHLALRHPGFVALKHKEYKDSVPRTEVVVAWGRALELGSDLGKVVKIDSNRDAKPGIYAIKPYEADQELFTSFNGERWSAPTFSKKDGSKCDHLIKNMPFRRKRI